MSEVYGQVSPQDIYGFLVIRFGANILPSTLTSMGFVHSASGEEFHLGGPAQHRVSESWDAGNGWSNDPMGTTKLR